MFMALEEFHLTIGIVVDYMHGILLGVTKTLMQLWFLPKNNKCDFFYWTPGRFYCGKVVMQKNITLFVICLRLVTNTSQ